MMHIGWPQGIAIALIIFHLVVAASLDGEPRTGTHKFSVAMISAVLNVLLLYWGGFFS